MTFDISYIGVDIHVSDIFFKKNSDLRQKRWIEFWI